MLAHLPPAGHARSWRAVRSSRNLISAPFRHGLRTAFDFAIGACLLAAFASWIRGGRYVYVERAVATGVGAPVPAISQEVEVS